MTRLVWMEFINTVYGKAKTQLWSAVATFFKTMFFLWLFMCACGSAPGNVMIIMGLILIGSYLDSGVSDVIYMIPGSLEKYLYAKLKMVIGLQFVLLIAVEIVRLVMHFNGSRQWYAHGEIFTFAGYSIFIVLYSVWKFYKRYTYQQFYQEKGVGAVAIVALFLPINVTDGDIVMNIICWLICLLYAAYTIHICLFVKKNIMLTTYFGGTE